MIQLLIDTPLLLLVIVSAIGYSLGQIKIKGSSLGVAAVLFVGLAFGALHPDLELPEFISQLGLVIFIYTVGLTSGAGFFASFRRKGLRDNLLVLLVLSLAAAVAAGLAILLGLPGPLVAGLFAGSLTNTPALAGVLERLRDSAPPGELEQLLNQPVVGYSIAYPVGVVGVILAVFAMQRLWRVDYQREAQNLRDLGVVNTQLQNQTILVTRPEIERETVQELSQKNGWDILFGRIRPTQNHQTFLAGAQTRLHNGDLVSVIGAPEDLEQVTGYLGQPSDVQLGLDRSEYDIRRIFVSDPKVAGHRLKDLNIMQQFGAIVTRVRRGDVELLAQGDTVLELGDRVRVLAKPEDIPAISKFFGDSYRALSEINLLSLNLGIAMGLLLGLIPIPLPGGITFQLGLAGGPLIVALILGKLGRTGPLVWQLPYSINLSLRQIGLVLFFAAVGARSGYAFFNTLIQGGGLTLFLAGAAITCVTALVTLWIGYKVLGIPMSLLGGIVAGVHTQPAVLSYSLEQSDNDLPNIGYATVFPIATIAKLLFAQLLLAVL
jgi:putative transport protein